MHVTKINPTFIKVAIGGFVLCGAVVAAVIGQPIITSQLNAWNIPRQPEGFSELYFSEQDTLPESVKPDSEHEFSFTIASHEHELTHYYYTLLARSETGAEEPLASGAATLQHNSTQTIKKKVAIPPLSPRMMVVVRIDYKTATSGETAKQHSIHHWLRMAGLPGSKT